MAELTIQHTALAANVSVFSNRTNRFFSSSMAPHFPLCITFEPIRFCDEQLNGETDRDDPEKSQYYPFQPVIALRDD
jgi:hypothetical protein